MWVSEYIRIQPCTSMYIHVQPCTIVDDGVRACTFVYKGVHSSADLDDPALRLCELLNYSSDGVVCEAESEPSPRWMRAEVMGIGFTSASVLAAAVASV